MNKDDSWSKDTGVLFEPLASYGTIPVDDYSSRKAHFDADDAEVPAFLDEFYFTNLFKLPTPQGCGGTPLDDSDNPFFAELLREELNAAGVDVIFSLGREAWEYGFRDDAEYVSSAFTGFGYEPAEIKGPINQVHGALYELSDGGYLVPLKHHSGHGSWRYSDSEETKDRKQRLERSLGYFADTGVI